MAATRTGRNYDVFLSFRGEDSNSYFIDHLYTALDERGIRTFRDDDQLKTGENISSELLNAIEESRASIIVFTVNYASSTWCLDKLVKILECRKTGGRLVLPVFFDADPSDVRKQSGSYEEAFARHEEEYYEVVKMKEKVQRWRTALTEAANLAGWDVRNANKRNQSKFIRGIVEVVLATLNQTHLNVATYPVGINSRLEDLKSLLNLWSNDVHIVGICGMGGIGKTTIAKAVYNALFRKFEGGCFLASVRETLEQPDGLLDLQRKLLSDILLKEDVKMSNVDRGTHLLKERLSCKRVLVILDDVAYSNQLNLLAIKRNCFGMGSRIIITTRDEHVLHELEVDCIYKVKELDEHESIRLFSWHAFRKDQPMAEFIELTKCIVSYVGGLPLALEVLGCFLSDNRSILEWKSALDKLKRIPYNQIQKKLRLCFDALDDKEKSIFLDIACFFIGMDKDYAVKILDSCGFFSEFGINVLIRRFLLTINEKNELRMHDLIRDMGRRIVHEESPKEPGKRSRLWFHKDVHDVLTKSTGTEEVQGLSLRNLPRSSRVCCSAEALRKMHKLRLLQLHFVDITGDFRHCSRELRWLCWHGFPLKFIPSKFYLENLVVLDMQRSKLEKVWKELKVLKNLKVLNLSHSICLTSTPDFIGLPNLEKLFLEGCTSLVEVHHSIGNLQGLVVLNLKDCRNLRSLPSSICKLKFLEDLNLSGCSGLERPLSKSRRSLLGPWRFRKKNPDSITLLPPSFLGLCSIRRIDLSNCDLSEGAIPSNLGSLSSLQELDLSNNNFCTIPDNISYLSQLKLLALNGCTRLHFLPPLPQNLKILCAKGCTSMESLPNLDNLSSLQKLDIRCNNFSSLPSSVGCLTQLKFLDLDKCTRLQTLPELPSSLKYLFAKDCSSMEKLPDLRNLSSLEELDLEGSKICSLSPSISCLSQLEALWISNNERIQSLPELPPTLTNLYVDGCTSLAVTNSNNLIEIQNTEKLESLQTGIHMEGCNSLENTFRKYLLQGPSGNFDVFLPGSEVPEWFGHQNVGSSVSFEVPSILDHKIQGLSVCAVYASDEADTSLITSPCTIITNKTTGFQWDYRPGATVPVTHQDHMWLGLIPHNEFGDQLDCGDQMEIEVEMSQPLRVKKCGVQLVYESNEKGPQSKNQPFI
ncbi:PREDICTED: TMV resistance protein N-like [Nelumbo nucifera]|uniref:ADP-ribosyl cyclase/cyclic ADP-ribose hydrolase n=2 Tax=Nelumbo nucifera TaxID=4432 RepID=A0A1U8ACZ2_NELNU|nr:PREDICTED: TMV resistance protein N-like [Nelumbo nucifera]DAD46190.1 TPA_asm: hypothetical protein HUJ06_004420 [Nelumbo nucifera]